MKQVFMRKQAFRAATVTAEDVPAPGCSSGTVLLANRYSLISAGTEAAAVGSSKRDMVVKALRDSSIRHSVAEMLVQDGLSKTAERVQYEMTKWTPLGYSGCGVAVEVGGDVDALRPGALVAYAGQGHAEYIRVQKRLCVPVPAGVTAKEAAFVALGAIALQGVRRAQVQVGDTVAVIGLGLVGQLVSQLLQAAGARVLGTDMLTERLELARQLGLEAGFLAGAEVAKQVVQATGGVGVDHVIICASGGSTAVQQAVAMARERGRIVVVGGVPLDVPRHEFYMKELDLVISRSYGPGRYDPQYEEHGVDYPIGYVRWTEQRNMQEFLRLMQAAKADVKRLVTHEFPVDQADQGYELLMNRPTECLGIVLRYDVAAEPPPRSVQIPERRVQASVRERPRVGVIGCGAFARQFHMPNLKRSNRLDFRTLVDSSAQNAKEMALRYGAQVCTTDARELLADSDIDAVFILTRDKSHADLAARALTAGKHVFCEKPLATSLEECRLLEAAGGAGDRVCMTGFNRRFAPLMQPVKEALQAGRGPKLIHYRVNAGTLKHDSWAYDPAHSAGRIVGEACHFVDLFYWLVGAEPVRVSCAALGECPATQRLEDLTATIEFADGSVATLLYTAQGATDLGKERLEAFCGGTAVALDNFRQLTIRGPRQVDERRRRMDKGHDGEFAHFVDVITGQSQPTITLRDGIRATEVCLALIDSARRGAAVSVAARAIPTAACLTGSLDAPAAR